MTHGVLAPQSSLFTSRETVNGSRGGETPTPWVRPADWLPITAPVRADKRMVGLHAVSEGGTNFVRIRARGAWRVDWGDGAGWTNVADNDVVEKNLVWGDYSPSTLTSDGFRQAVITVEAQSGQNLTMLYLNERPVGVTSTSYGSGWLDVAIGSSSPLELRPVGFSTGVFHPLLERFVCDATLTSSGASFSNSYALREVELDLASVTNTSNMFVNCYSLQSVPLFNLASAANTNTMFYGCSSLQSVPLFDLSSVTNATNMFYGCSALRWSDATGIRYAISYAGLNLSAAALDNIYTNLGTAAGAQTITVTGNWGTAGDDPTIATAKGWTVAA